MLRLAVTLFLIPAVFAADPAGFAIWKTTDLKAIEKKLAPKAAANAGKVASQPLADYGDHTTQVAHREGSGTAELHEKWADIFIIHSGEATILIGGMIEDGKVTAPGEIRGPSLSGGAPHPVSAGDIVHIPANTPHQMLVNSGKQVTYFVVKVASK